MTIQLNENRSKLLKNYILWGAEIPSKFKDFSKVKLKE